MSSVRARGSPAAKELVEETRKAKKVNMYAGSVAEEVSTCVVRHVVSRWRWQSVVPTVVHRFLTGRKR